MDAIVIGCWVIAAWAAVTALLLTLKKGQTK